MPNKVYDLITERILTQLDNGVVPWRKPWGLQPGFMPMNGTNSREYRGINALMLGLSGYSDVRWMTYKQATERGALVRKGEKSTPIIFWKQSQIQDTNDHGETITKTIPILRKFAVFNVEQIEGLKLPKLAVQENTFNAIGSRGCSCQHAPAPLHRPRRTEPRLLQSAGRFHPPATPGGL